MGWWASFVACLNSVFHIAPCQGAPGFASHWMMRLYVLPLSLPFIKQTTPACSSEPVQVKEPLLVRDVLYACQGITGKFMEYQVGGAQLSPPSAKGHARALTHVQHYCCCWQHAHDQAAPPPLQAPQLLPLPPPASCACLCCQHCMRGGRRGSVSGMHTLAGIACAHYTS